MTELSAPSFPKVPDQKSMHLLALVPKSAFLNIDCVLIFARTVLSISTVPLVVHNFWAFILVI